MATIIKINGCRYDNFDDLNVTLNFDSLSSTFSFSALFDPNNATHRKIFKPLTYPEVEIYNGDTLLLTGNILSQNFSPGPKRQLVPVSGYSKTGILSNVSIPPEKYPLEVLQKSLVDITENLIDTFGISLTVDPSVEEDANILYEKSTAKDSQTIGAYIATLASQRNIIVSHTAAGNLLFTRPTKNTASIATYRENVPSLRFNLSVNGQNMHSEVTVQKQATVGSDLEGDETAENTLVTQYRPLIKEQTNGSSGDTENAALNAISAELKNIQLTINTDRWIWFDGENVSTISTNNYIDIISPQCFLYNRTSFFVQQVIFTENAKERTASLTCVLPETFNGNTPNDIFST